MALNEACSLWIEQRISEELEDKKTSGKSLRAIGKEISKEIQRVFEAKVKPETIRKKAERMEESGTNVPSESKVIENTTETPKILENRHPQGGGTRAGSGRKKKEYQKINTEFFGTMEGTEDFCNAFEVFYAQIQNAKLEQWQIVPKRSAIYCLKLIDDLIGE